MKSSLWHDEYRKALMVYCKEQNITHENAIAVSAIFAEMLLTVPKEIFEDTIIKEYGDANSTKYMNMFMGHLFMITNMVGYAVLKANDKVPLEAQKDEFLNDVKDMLL